MTNRFSNISPVRYILAASLVVFVLYNTSIFTGFSIKETLLDIPAWGTALSCLAVGSLFFWLHDRLPNGLNTAIFLLLITIWGYVSFHFLTFEDYRFSDLPNDAKQSLLWLKENPKKVLIYALAIGLVFGLRALRGVFAGITPGQVPTGGREWLAHKKGSK